MKRTISAILRHCMLVLAAGVLVTAAGAELFPQSRRINWSANVTVGVPGGIPHGTRLIDVTLPPYNADNTGTSDSSSAIQNAIDSATRGDVIYLPSGIFRINRTIYLGPNRDGISVRGAGMDATVIDSRVNMVFYVGSNSNYSWNYPSANNTVLGGLKKESNTLVLANTESYKIGQIIRIALDNQTNSAAIQAGATPVVSVGGYELLRSQLTRIIGKTDTTLIVFPTIYYTPDPGLSARVHVLQNQSDGVGIEDLTIDGANTSMLFPLMFEQTYGCWVKGVRILRTNNYGIYFTNSLNCEVRECYIADRKTAGSNGAGILSGRVSGSLFEDNIVLNIFPAFEINYSSMGNVVAYNLMENSVGGTLNTNHAPHNSYNLYEGNVTPNVQCDGYYGSASDDTFFRNWIHGTNLQRSLRTFRVSLNRFTRNYSFIGNIIGEAGMTVGGPYSFGNPNMGNATFFGNCASTEGRFWNDWKARATLARRDSDTAATLNLISGNLAVGQLGYIIWGNGSKRMQFSVASKSGDAISFTGGIGNPLPAESTDFDVYTGPSGYQELDLDVQKTTFLKANYNYLDRAIPASEVIVNEILPDSLYRTSKPAFFGNLPWPAFDSLHPNPSFESIPAGYRYVHQTAVPGTMNLSAPQAPTSLQVQGQ